MFRSFWPVRPARGELLGDCGVVRVGWLALFALSGLTGRAHAVPPQLDITAPLEVQQAPGDLPVHPLDTAVWRQPADEARTVTAVLDPVVLQHVQRAGFGLEATLGLSAPRHDLPAPPRVPASAARLAERSARYRAIADVLGQAIAHDPVTDQLPATLAAGLGDVPDMVRALRGFEDHGARSARDKTGSFIMRHLANNAAYPYRVESDGDEPRHFDTRWLRSPHARFDLVALVNRIDRTDFAPGTCGELRYIYRLGYTAKTGARGSLPFFINVVHALPRDGTGCQKTAAAWQMDAQTKARISALAPKTRGAVATNAEASAVHAWLKPRLARGTFRQAEVNFQALRFTSGYMHDFGGQALYMQRIFRAPAHAPATTDSRAQPALVPVPLENTPDVRAIAADPALLDALIAFLTAPENLAALDEGRVVLPNFGGRFLTTRALSWSTLGRARLANKPYRAVLSAHPKALAALRALDISKLHTIRTTDGLIERLDNLTCMGCHQTAGTAGFHMLGYPAHAGQTGNDTRDKQARDEVTFNAQETPFSPHVFAELARRRAYGDALAAPDRAPNRYRPHAAMPHGTWTDTGRPTYAPLPVGALCLRGQNVATPVPTPAFAGSPRCAPHRGQATVCRATVTSDRGAALFGECVLTEPTPAGLFAGGTCFEGVVRDHTLTAKNTLAPPPARATPDVPYNFTALTDKFSLTRAIHPHRGKGQTRYSCGSPKGGAPLGRRGRKCSTAEETFAVLDGHVPHGQTPVTLAALRAGTVPDEVCANQGGNGFDMCAASGDAGRCLERRVARAMLDTCSTARFCREDYICQRLPRYDRIAARDYGRKKYGTRGRGKRVNRATPDAIDAQAITALREAGIGFCVPTYFLFNMRTDGHPSPVTGKPAGTPRIDRKQPLRGHPH